MRLRAIYGIKLANVPDVLVRSTSMHDGLEADPGTYTAPNPLLPAFLTLIQNTATAQQAVKLRTVGAAEKRDVELGLLISGMESQRSYIQVLADNSPSRAAAIIKNAGLLVAESPDHPKELLTVKPVLPSGTLRAVANVGMLLAAAAPSKPNEIRFFNWSITLDGGKTFAALPPTTKGITLIPNLTPLASVGVRVNLNGSEGPGEWSQTIYALVR